jgi:hypothetical protein
MAAFLFKLETAEGEPAAVYPVDSLNRTRRL